jgi:hypothetical protein
VGSEIHRSRPRDAFRDHPGRKLSRYQASPVSACGLAPPDKTNVLISDVGCKTVANMIKGKTPEEIRKLFNIVNDFTPEEEVTRILFSVLATTIDRRSLITGSDQEGERELLVSLDTSALSSC